MPQKPETKFIGKIRKAILNQHPDAYFKKHQHQSIRGIPDLEIIIGNNPIAYDCWFEVKWLKNITNKRKISYRPLQKEDLEKRSALGVPCGLLVGCPKGIAWYHGLCLPTVAHIEDFWTDTPFNIDMFLNAHYGLMAVSKLGG